MRKLGMTWKDISRKVQIRVRLIGGWPMLRIELRGLVLCSL